LELYIPLNSRDIRHALSFIYPSRGLLTMIPQYV
jgi:hypothetical protein